MNVRTRVFCVKRNDQLRFVSTGRPSQSEMGPFVSESERVTSNRTRVSCMATRTRDHRIAIAWLLSLLVVLCSGTPLKGQVSKRALTVQDVLNLQSSGDFVLSPDGKELAVVIKRARQPQYGWLDGPLNEYSRADIWMTPTSNASPSNITGGRSDYSGSWAPVWSPDGQRITFFSTRGGRIRLWMWDSKSRLLRLVSEDPVNPTLGKPVWLSNYKLVCSVVDENAGRLLAAGTFASAEIAEREWEKYKAGTPSAPRPVQSGVVANFEVAPASGLLIVNVKTGRKRQILRGEVGNLARSPDGRYVAFLRKTGVVTPKPGTQLKRLLESRYQAGIISADGRLIYVSPENLNVLKKPPLWCANSSCISFVALENDFVGGRRAAFRYDIIDGHLSELVPSDMVAVIDGFDAYPGDVGIRSLADAEIIIRSSIFRSGDVGDTEYRNDRADWWLVSHSSNRNLTATLPNAPDKVFAWSDNTIVGIVDSDLWLVRTDGPAHRLRRESGCTYSDIIYASRREALVSPGGSMPREQTLVVSGSCDGSATFFGVNPADDSVSRLEKPTQRAFPVAFGGSATTVWLSHSHDGSYIWSVTRKGTSKLLLSLNTFLKGIQGGEFETFQYSTKERTSLTAQLLLPRDYVAGRRYPLIVWADAGNILGPSPYFLLTVNSDLFLNLQLLAAHGYAVLLPSVPLKCRERPGCAHEEDQLLSVAGSVLPAIDSLIAKGVADPNRIGIFGHSHAGYTALSLITQTDRFKAAVVVSAMTDLRSLYGVFASTVRYMDRPQDDFYATSGCETPTTWGLSSPPWEDSERYLKNSPLSYVDRVKTPVLLVYGDMDYFGMPQAEQFFTGLYRLNKRADFVRYWGEGHNIENPTNIRDFWQRVYSWFDEQMR